MRGFILQVMDEIGEIAVFPDPVGLQTLDQLDVECSFDIYLMSKTSLP
jgi:hypothetical protein